MFRLPLVYLTSPADGFPWAYLREILHGLPQMPNVQNRVKILPKSLTVWVGCTNVTDDRQTTDTINYIADTWPTSKILSLSLRRSLFPTAHSFVYMAICFVFWSHIVAKAPTRILTRNWPIRQNSKDAFPRMPARMYLFGIKAQFDI